jgi:hypothetical protein
MVKLEEKLVGVMTGLPIAMAKVVHCFVLRILFLL